MKCPYCGEEMLKGRAINSMMRTVDLVFKRDGEKFQLKDIVPYGNRIDARISALSSLDAFFCPKCRKLAILTKCFDQAPS